MTKKRKLLLIALSILLIGFLIPENMSIPAAGATKSSWNKDSFSYYPWGKCGTHKGIDIFAHHTCTARLLQLFLIYRE